MAEPVLQVCPTRIDATTVLFAHKVDRTRCQERQRKRYHKCFTCAWNNNYVAIHGKPEVVAVEAGAGAGESSAPTDA
jgi:hypothetical protein